MTIMISRIRRLLPLLALILAGCSDFFYEAAEGVPVQLALSYRLADGVEPGPSLASPGEAFDRADRAQIRILHGSETLFDDEVALDAAGADKSAEVELTLDEVVTLTISLDLRSEGTSLFTGTATAQVTPGVSADVEIPLNPVAASMVIPEGDATLSTIGETLQLTATTLFATGETLEGVTAEWSATGSAVSVSASGLVTALENGESTVTAQFGAFEASVLVTVFDPCVVDATALDFGASAAGALTPLDCFDGTRLVDQFAVFVDQDSPFRVNYSASGYSGAHAFYSLGGQVTGLTDSSSREYILPADELYFLFATSVESGSDAASAPTGSYTVAVDYISEPQVGCGPTALVTFGSRGAGSITGSDCVDDVIVEEGVVRHWDGFTIILFPGESVTATMKADFDTWFTYWRDGELIEGHFDAHPGESRSLSGSGSSGSVHAFFVLSAFNEGTGSYEIEFSGSGGGAAGAVRRVVLDGR